MGDISNDYLFYHQNSVPAIREHLGVSINILIVLRNPVERAYSNYLHHVRNGWEPLPFLDALKAEDERAQRRWSWSFQYRRTGLYADPIAHFLESFTNVKTLLFEDLVSGPRGLREIHEFLGLPLEEVDFGRLGIHNATWTPRSRYLDRLTAPDNQLLSRLPAGPATVVRQWLDRWNHTRPDMDPEARTCLKDYFTEDLRRLQNLLNRDLSHWFQIPSGVIQNPRRRLAHNMSDKRYEHYYHDRICKYYHLWENPVDRNKSAALAPNFKNLFGTWTDCTDDRPARHPLGTRSSRA